MQGVAIKNPIAPMAKPPKAKSETVARRFEARLERMRSRLGWTIIHVPFDAVKLWGLRGQIKVKGEINDFAFRTSLFPTGVGGHILLVNKRMQKGSRAVEGSFARFRLELDTEKRKIGVPDQLEQIFKRYRSLRRWYDELNPSTRKDIYKWISDPKSSAARTRRAEQLAERLLAVMDAERELPPVLQLAFARQSRAREGWDAMSVARRRGHLFGIFYYRTPDGQRRRIEKMLEDATTVANKSEGRKR
jgi:uncharacterized protein YdeI (YjbR/CyaY-like superfamily)